jgi:hypothetical protein
MLSEFEDLGAIERYYHIDTMKVDGVLLFGNRGRAHIIEADADSLEVQQRRGNTFRVLGSIVDGEVEHGRLIEGYPMATRGLYGRSSTRFYTYQPPGTVE